MEPCVSLGNRWTVVNFFLELVLTKLVEVLVSEKVRSGSFNSVWHLVEPELSAELVRPLSDVLIIINGCVLETVTIIIIYIQLKFFCKFGQHLNLNSFPNWISNEVTHFSSPSTLNACGENVSNERHKVAIINARKSSKQSGDIFSLFVMTSNHHFLDNLLGINDSVSAV